MQTKLLLKIKNIQIVKKNKIQLRKIENYMNREATDYINITKMQSLQRWFTLTLFLNIILNTFNNITYLKKKY